MELHIKADANEWNEIQESEITATGTGYNFSHNINGVILTCVYTEYYHLVCVLCVCVGSH